MKYLSVIIIVAFYFQIVIVTAVDEVDIRGPVVEVIDGKEYSWDSQQFPGFFYDSNKGIGTESIKLRIANDVLQQDSGIEYQTTAQPEKFELGEWGSYYTIGFLGQRYFSGYTDDSYLLEKSNNLDLINNYRLSKVLIDKNNLNKIINPNQGLWLEDGYKLNLIDADSEGKIFINLTKNGNQVDSTVVTPPVTYCYKIELNGPEKDFVVIAIHFINSFSGQNSQYATVDAIFQILDTFTSIQTDKRFDNMTIRGVDNYYKQVIMKNNRDFGLKSYKDTRLMENFWIKTANQEILTTAPLRFCIYRKENNPGVYEIRGPVSFLVNGNSFWNAESFAGFYYDLDNNIKTEDLSMTITNGNLLEEVNGIEYTTHTQPADFSYKPWGKYEVIGFLGEKFFASYVKGSYLFDKSENKRLIDNKRLSKVLYDSNMEVELTSKETFRLKEGYNLSISGTDITGDRVLVDLSKDGKIIDSKIIQPSSDTSKTNESTYSYKDNLEDTKNIITIAIHFKDSFRNNNTEFTAIDGIWQISSAIKGVDVDQQFYNMKITHFDCTNGIIVMNNINRINLNANKPLMGFINIATTDPDPFEGNLHRFYLYKEVPIEEFPFEKSFNVWMGWF